MGHPDWKEAEIKIHKDCPIYRLGCYVTDLLTTLYCKCELCVLTNPMTLFHTFFHTMLGATLLRFSFHADLPRNQMTLCAFFPLIGKRNSITWVLLGYCCSFVRHANPLGIRLSSD